MPKKQLRYFLAVLLTLAIVLPAYCTEEPKEKALEAIEFLSGFAKAKLRERGDYEMAPLIVDFDFNLKSLTKKIGLNPWGLFQFQIEPFFSTIYEPKINLEVGNGFILKLGILPEAFKLQPYIKFGPGIMYMTQHTNEQSTQFNFFEYAGAGMHYYFNQNHAFTLEGRWRHLSNASLDYPNRGITTFFVLAGIAYQF